MLEFTIRNHGICLTCFTREKPSVEVSVRILAYLGVIVVWCCARTVRVLSEGGICRQELNSQVEEGMLASNSK